MKFIKSNWITILILIVVIISGYFNYTNTKEIKSLGYEISDLESDVSTLQEYNEELKQELEDCESSSSNVTSQSNIQVEPARNAYQEYIDAHPVNGDGFIKKERSETEAERNNQQANNFFESQKYK